MQLNKLLLIFITYLAVLNHAVAADSQWDRLTELVRHLEQLQEARKLLKSHGVSFNIKEKISETRKEFLRGESDNTEEEIFNILQLILMTEQNKLYKMKEIREIIAHVGQLTFLPDNLSELIYKSYSNASWWQAFFKQAIKLHQLDKKRSALGLTSEQSEKLSQESQQIELNLSRILKYMSELFADELNQTLMYREIVSSPIRFLSEAAQYRVLRNFFPIMTSIKGIEDNQIPLIIRNTVYEFFGLHFQDMENVPEIILNEAQLSDFQKNSSKLISVPDSLESWWDVFFELAIHFHQVEMRRDRLELKTEELDQVTLELQQLKRNLIVTLEYIAKDFNTGYSSVQTQILKQIAESKIFLSEDSRTHVLTKIKWVMTHIEDINEYYFFDIIRDIVDKLFSPHFNDMTQTIIEKYRTLPEIKYLNLTRNKRTPH